MKRKLPRGRWLLLFFLPSLVGAILTLPIFGELVSYRDKLENPLIIISVCYLFAMLLIHGRINKQRGTDLITGPLLMLCPLFLANVLIYCILCLTVTFAGCLCARDPGFRR